MNLNPQETNNLIALLSTGDEISHGDILNTNAQEIAYRLFNHGIQLGMQLVTGDNILLIENAIRYLLTCHRVVIITGGLGPTSDDVTRYALSHALNRPLVFDRATWKEIKNFLKNLGYTHPPDANRQQALFPEHALIIPNRAGTAAGCIIKADSQFIIMLPGPPSECLPMIEKVIIPFLIENQLPQIFYHKKWLLFGVSEGKIAMVLDEVAKPFHCLTGYRLFYPYIEFKIYSQSENEFKNAITKIEDTIKPYIIGDGKFTASQLLREKLLEFKIKLAILDEATCGLLESTLCIPQTKPYLIFHSPPFEDLQDVFIKITGLKEYWLNNPIAFSSLHIHFETKTLKEAFQFEIPFRGERIKQYAVELICREILNFHTQRAISA